MPFTRAALSSVIAGGLIATALVAAAQSPARKVPRIGYLSAGSDSPRDAVFRQGLQQLGYIEGQTIVIESRFADGKFDRLPGFAAELVRLNLDVIVTSSTPASRAARQATQTTPIVMALTGDVTVIGGIASLARPGGNITGLTNISTELGGKRLGLLREVIPKLARVAAFRNPANQSSIRQFAETEAAARAVGIQVQQLEVGSPADFDKAFEAATRGRADALILLPDNLYLVHGRRLAELALKQRLPTMTNSRELTGAGNLMSYGPDQFEMHRRAADYVDKILKGAKPGDLPIEQPTKFELAFNLKTAQALGLTIPQSLLLRADEVFR